MRNKDLEVGDVVSCQNGLWVVISISRELVLENVRGKRIYASAGSVKRPIVKIEIDLPIVIEKDSPGYHVYCPQLKGFHTAGDTISEAMRNAMFAGKGMLESIIKHYNEEHSP